MAAATVRRRQVLAFRLRQHQLDGRPVPGGGRPDVALLDYGVQDTGPDGVRWALALRGGPAAAGADLALAWTWRGAPHAYRRPNLEAVMVATAPFSEADAAKRVFDAARCFRDARIPVLDALRTVAGHLRDIVSAPTSKGEASRRLSELAGPAYLRYCRSCDATHVHEMPFRLAALQAGLELEPGTAPPVLRPVAGLTAPLYARLADGATPAFDPLRNYLRFYGPARARDAAAFLDAPVKEVTPRWPPDAVEVLLADGGAAGEEEPRSVLAEHLDALSMAEADGRRSVRLVAPHDPWLQGRDRELLVPDAARRKALWPVLGRPGAVLVDGEVAGTWRPRRSGRRLTVRLEPWVPLSPADRAQVEEQAGLLAGARGAELAGVVEE